jgi:hypothetical protein
MIFNEGKIKSKSVLKWQEESKERVSFYVYLEVPFSENLNFKRAKEHFFRKAKILLAISEV